MTAIAQSDDLCQHAIPIPIPPYSMLSFTPALAQVAASAASAPLVKLPATEIDYAAALKPFTADGIANGFTTLTGVVVGAMLAYLLQRRLQKTIERKNEQTAAHRLMFVLLQQINTLVLIQRDYVFAHLRNPMRFISIPASSAFDLVKNTLQLTELSFLIDSKAGRDILYEFYIAQESYIEALNQWNMRSVWHLEKIQPALAAKISIGEAVTLEQLEVLLGTHLYHTILNSTDGCLLGLSRAFRKLADVKVKTRAYLVERFNSNDFTDFSFEDTYGLDRASEN